MIRRVHEYSAYKFREIADHDVNLHEDTGLKRGTRAVWPDNNDSFAILNSAALSDIQHTDLPSKRNPLYPLGTQPAKLSQVMWGERKRELWCQEVEREDDDDVDARVAPLPS